MDEPAFRRYLKRLGKQAHVIDNLIRQARKFESFLAERQIELDSAGPQDILDYAAALETQQAGSARVSIRGVALYYKFADKLNLVKVAAGVREKAIAQTRHVFKLEEFRGVNPDHIAWLAAAGIVNVEQMLEAGKTRQSRRQLAKQTGVPIDSILELVKLSDLARLSGVKATRARLYYDAGADTLDKIAGFEPQALLQMTNEFVARTGFDGIAPLPKEIRNAVMTARKLPKIVEW